MSRIVNSTMEMTEVRKYIESHLSADFTVDVPEQNPIVMGDRHLYLVQLVRTDTGEETTAHAVVPEGLDDVELELVHVQFPLSPFKPTISITSLVA